MIAAGGLNELCRVDEIVARHALSTPERTALTDGDSSLTYGQLQNLIEMTAGWLLQTGVRPRDRVVLVCENSFAAIALYLSCTRIDAWPVIVNARLSAAEIDGIRAHCQPRLTVIAAGAATTAKAHAKRIGAAIVAELECMGSVWATQIEETAEPELQDQDTQIAAIIYTTGTTGRPRGVMLTHANLLFVARATAEARHLSSRDRVYATLPISHSLGLTGVLLGSLLSGAEVHLAARFDPARALANLRAGSITAMIGTPSMYALLVEYAKRRGLATIPAPTLRLISSAGAPLDLATKAQVEAAFGQTLHNGYGISECGPSISLTALTAPRTDCSVGRLLPGVEAKLAGGSDIGELYIRSPGVMHGYYRAPQETRDAIDELGWFRTGDLARIENDHLFIVGRAKEMIIRFGFNVYPAEVEAVLNAHPTVLRSAVVGRKRDDTEEIVAFVQLAGSQTNISELADHAGRQLASYKCPTDIVVIPEMPMAANGKILKAALKEKYLSENSDPPLKQNTVKCAA